MDYKKLYKMARVSVKICTALEQVGNDSRNLSPRFKLLSKLADKLQHSLTPEENKEVVRIIGYLNTLRWECKKGRIKPANAWWRSWRRMG